MERDRTVTSKVGRQTSALWPGAAVGDQRHVQAPEQPQLPGHRRQPVAVHRARWGQHRDPRGLPHPPAGRVEAVAPMAGERGGLGTPARPSQPLGRPLPSGDCPEQPGPRLASPGGDDAPVHQVVHHRCVSGYAPGCAKAQHRLARHHVVHRHRPRAVWGR